MNMKLLQLLCKEFFIAGRFEPDVIRITNCKFGLCDFHDDDDVSTTLKLTRHIVKTSLVFIWVYEIDQSSY